MFSVLKAGFVFSGKAGSGLVIARLPDGSWSAPSCIATGGVGWGLQIGADLTEFVIILNSEDAVRAFSMGGNVTIGGLSLSAYQIFACLFSLAVCVIVWAVLTKTRIGMIVRAATEDSERTRALGINVTRWVTPVFGFGIALAGLAGVLAAPFRAITADMGSNFVIILFAVVVIGGLGSILGAVVGGFLVGIIENVVGVYLGTELKLSVALVVIVAVLVLKPSGLFGRVHVARV